MEVIFMSIFDNVLFEGQQADEYKARKEKEAADRHAKEMMRADRYDPVYTGGRIEYSGPGDKDKYRNPSKSDKDRSSKAEELVNREEHRRGSDLISKQKAYSKASDKAKASEVNEPRPRGLFKGKEKKEHDTKIDIHNKDVEARDKKKAEFDQVLKSYNRVRDNEDVAIDAANRHIRRHPKQYKESGIFESVELV